MDLYLLDRTVNEREFHERPSRIAALLFVLLLVMGPSGDPCGTGHVRHAVRLDGHGQGSPGVRATARPWQRCFDAGTS